MAWGSHSLVLSREASRLPQLLSKIERFTCIWGLRSVYFVAMIILAVYGKMMSFCPKKRETLNLSDFNIHASISLLVLDSWEAPSDIGIEKN
jgi:hypothetical protein